MPSGWLTEVTSILVNYSRSSVLALHLGGRVCCYWSLARPALCYVRMFSFVSFFSLVLFSFFSFCKCSAFSPKILQYSCYSGSLEAIRQNLLARWVFKWQEHWPTAALNQVPLNLGEIIGGRQTHPHLWTASQETFLTMHTKISRSANKTLIVSTMPLI